MYVVVRRGLIKKGRGMLHKFKASAKQFWDKLK